MRDYQKNQCIQTLSLLVEAHGEIAKCIAAGQTETAVDLLVQCQQAAIEVGNLIDAGEGNDTVVVSPEGGEHTAKSTAVEDEPAQAAGGSGAPEVCLLEEYCELLWQISEDIRAGSTGRIDEHIRSLTDLLRRVAEGLKNRISTQRVVVFLPYKASMWDALEPVWKKLQGEPDVETMVIPIPYFDKNSDGSFRQMHDESGEFPEDVPVKPWQETDLAALHPDAIYIHNPYDEANLVTSIHPDFYSSRIKEFTEELVYIPYFVLGDIDPNNKEALKGVEHFIALPGIVHATKVIVQSPNWREAYIRVMIGFTGEETRPYWESKIVSGGSPKLERVRNLTARDHEIPEEWQRVIEKPDGSRKKVIFYNTTVVALLEKNEVMLDKIKRVFEVFRENSNEVALLWRPHPLIEATLVSMRPQLWDKYRTLVEDYRAAGWGIYDDSPKLERAIAVSDAYYGDHSSVVQLYQETGKPIMIQNVHV